MFLAMSTVTRLPIDELQLARIGIKVRSKEFEDYPNGENAKGVIRQVQKWNHCLAALGVPNEVRVTWMSIDTDCSDCFVAAPDPEWFYARLAYSIIEHLKKYEARRLKSGSKVT